MHTFKPLVERIPTVATLYRKLRDRSYALREPQLTPMGFRFVGMPAMVAGTFEPMETAIVTELLAETDVFINVGANVGYYCCRACAVGKPVIAFEPMEENLAALFKNLRANGWTQDIEVFPMALSERPGLLEIFGGGTGASLIRGWSNTPDSFVRMVPSSTMDIVVGQRFAGKRLLIVVDVEGAEALVLRGAQAVLRREPKPIWMVEVHSTEHQPPGVAVSPGFLETFHTFWDAGYESYAADVGRRRVAQDEVEAIGRGAPHVLGTHNFIFRPRAR